MNPLILTISIDPILLEALNAMRQEHFPAERNFLSAHVTLFHNLPGEQIDQITHTLHGTCHGKTPFDLLLPSLRFHGQGVAINVTSPQLLSVRSQLATLWFSWLTPQDRQPFAPHATIQNKVAPHQAKALFAQLSAVWSPLQGKATGLRLWHYRGGPWEIAGEFPFDVPV